MSLSDYYRTIAEFDEMRTKLHAANLAYRARFGAYGDPYVFEHNGHNSGQTVSSIRRKNQMRLTL